LKRLPGVNLIALDITLHPSSSQALFAIEILKSKKCSVLFTINEWGIDCDGLFNEYINKNGVIHINWCVDDPFFEELTSRKKFISSPLRFDFVSDRDYMARMIEKGYQVSFMPLATDPNLFFPETIIEDKRIVFVGNSYLSQVDGFIYDVNEYIEPLVPFIASIVDEYKKDCLKVDLEAQIVEHLKKVKGLTDGNVFEKVAFVCKQIAGYLYRKDVINGLAQNFPEFTVYGDDGWKTIIGNERVKKVSYGEDLRKLYNSVSVNIDCNRAVIRNGLTQRTFDVLACKKFIITSNKAVINELFETYGQKREVVMFRNRHELLELVRYYLDNPEEKNEIAERGHARVLQEHTYDHRIRSMFRYISLCMKNEGKHY
jgi:spore maturation protein CgeB